MIPRECKQLAETSFPIDGVSRHVAREKSIQHRIFGVMSGCADGIVTSIFLRSSLFECIQKIDLCRMNSVDSLRSNRIPCSVKPFRII